MKQRILIVDDEPDIIQLLIIHLGSHNGTKFAFYTATNGKEAIAAYTDCKPHIVIMDLRMPGMNGAEATKQILLNDPTANIYIFTAYLKSEIEQKALATGAKETIPKTLDWKGAAQKIVNLLEGEKQNEKNIISKRNGNGGKRAGNTQRIDS